jgi:cytochrome c-type biogenesis protein CcmE
VGKLLKIGLTVVVLVTAFAGMVRSTLDEGAAYYKHVDEMMSEPQKWHGKRLQLHGMVAKDSIQRRRDSLEYRFVVEQGGVSVTAFYTGIVPDTFKDGSEVVLAGVLTPDGFRVAPNGVMAKCPSKYQPSGPS